MEKRQSTSPTGLFDVVVYTGGEVAIALPDQPLITVRGKQPPIALAYLALNHRLVQREHLAEILWGEHLSPHWQGALRGIISKVRAAFVEAGLPGTVLTSGGGKIGFDQHLRIYTDLHKTQDLLAEANQALAQSELQRAASLSEEARTLLVRPFVPENDSDWSRTQREHRQTLLSQAVHTQIRALAKLPDTNHAIAIARQHVRENPLDEIGYHLLIEALLAAGRRTEALEEYENLDKILNYELGIHPAPNTTALVAAIEATLEPGTPGVLGAVDQEPFVGRVSELKRLLRVWQSVIETNRPQMVVLEGPAGIGKTRLASQFATWAEHQGAQTLWGRTRADAGRAYGAIAEALDEALANEPSLIQKLGYQVAGLANLIPHLHSELENYRTPTDEALARTHLFSSARAVMDALVSQPTVLVLDDLHWTTAETISLLEAMLDRLEAPLLVVATARPNEAVLQQGLLSLQRQIDITTLELSGFDHADLLEIVANHSVPPDQDSVVAAEAIHQATAGLPFFVAELARDARQRGEPINATNVPTAVQDWILRQVNQLEVVAQQLLYSAAVIDSDISIDLLVEVTGSAPALTFHQIDRLITGGILQENRNRNTIEFSHAITRGVIYGEIRPTWKAHLHQQVAEALVAQAESKAHFSDLQLHAVVAHHYLHAGPSNQEHAAHYSCLAGRNVMATGAWELAARYFEVALACTNAPETMAQALIGHARAVHRLGNISQAKEDLLKALGIARSYSLALVEAEAAFATAGRAGRGTANITDDEQIEIFRQAIAALTAAENLAPAEEDRRQTLLSHLERELALALLLSEHVAERYELVERSINRARTVKSDPTVIAAALLGRRLVKLEAADLPSRLADLDEVLALPVELLDPETVVAAHTYRHEDLLRQLNFTEAERAMTAARAMAERFNLPYWRWALTTWQGLRANQLGNLDAAEQLAFEAAAMQTEVAEATACLGVNLVNIRLYQGRGGEVLSLLADAVRDFPQIPTYRAVLALCAWESGERELARESYEYFADANFTNLPDDTNRYLGLGVLAHVAFGLEDQRGGAELAKLLTPYLGQWIQLNCYGGGGAHWGPASHQLARLQVLAGNLAEAEILFSQAQAEAKKAEAPLALQRIEADVATLLVP